MLPLSPSPGRGGAEGDSSELELVSSQSWPLQLKSFKEQGCVTAAAASNKIKEIWLIQTSKSVPSFLHKILQTPQEMSSPRWRRLIYLISSFPCIWMQTTGIYPITSRQSEKIPHSNNFNQILRGDLWSFCNISLASEPLERSKAGWTK